VNRTLIVALARHRMSSPIRLALILVLFSFPLLFVTAVPPVGLAAVDNAFLFTLIFGVGMVGQDVSSGVLQLILARPVTRAEYALSRWLGAALPAASIAVAQVAMAALITAARHAPIPPQAIAIAAGNQVTTALGTAAVLLLFSSLVPGATDLLVLFVLKFLGSMLPVAGNALRRPEIGAVGEELARWSPPELDLHQVVGAAVSWHALATYLSIVAISLALGIVILNRKELSYAAG